MSDRNNMRAKQSWANWLLEVGDLRFGLYSCRILLLVTIVIGLCPVEFSAGPQNETPATVFSWMPESLLRNGLFFTIVRVALIASAVLWWFRIWTPVSCWSTALIGVLMWSLRMENLTNGAHIFTVANMLLIIHAMWFHFYHRQINAAIVADKDLNRTQAAHALLAEVSNRRRCYPRWVFFLCVFYLGWFHSLAGFAKIATSGLAWGNGVSLQLWTKLFGWEPSPFGQLLLLDTRLTALMQTGALAIECGCILVIFHRWLRYGFGFAIFGFYLGVLTTFVDFGFHFNAILVAWFLLPVDWWMGLRFGDPEKTEPII
jgi:hypothetical protein